MVSVNRHRRAIEKMYTDRATVYRYGETTDPTSGKTKQVPATVYSNEPCRISQKALASNGQTEAQNDIKYEVKLFISPDLAIQQGDMLEVTRGTVTRKYEAGEPFPYSTHQEVSIQRKEWA